MRDQQELLNKAANAKVRLIGRRDKITLLHSSLAAYHGGQGADLKPDRIETMQVELDKATDKQAREGLIYATLRWALGGSDDIDDSRLDL